MKAIEEFAAAHHALISQKEAERIGISRDQLDREVRTRRLERVGRQVFRVPGSVRTWHQILLAAVWAAGDGAFASHLSGGALRHLPGFPPGPVEVLRDRHASRAGLAAVIRETCYLPRHHTSEVDGIPTTSPARTLFDLCGIVSRGRADWMLEHALNTRLVTYPQMQIVLAECARQGRAGVTVLRELLAKRGDDYVPTESVLEAMVLAVLEGAGLPLPERQVVLADDERVIGRVDFLYPAARLVLEANGHQHGGWLATQEDARRYARLGALGYDVIPVDWRMLTREPELFVANVRAKLKRARMIPA